MMVSTLKGRFRAFEGAVRIDEENPANSIVTAVIDVASIDTGVDQRDEHLRSDDFFNAAAFPKITFRSTKLGQAPGGDWKLTGDLAIRGVTKSVDLDVEFDGRGIDAFGKDRAGFSATTKINRKDFGVNWNGLIEAGSGGVSDTVKIALNIAIVREG